MPGIGHKKVLVEWVKASKIETVIANLTQMVSSQNINAHMQTKNEQDAAPDWLSITS